MIFISDDALKYLKRKYIKYCFTTFLMFVGISALATEVSEQKKTINNLTKKVEELSLKGD